MPFVLAGVAALAALVVGVGVAVLLLGGDADEEAAPDREEQAAPDGEALRAAAVDSDAAAVARLLAEQPELAEGATEIDTGETESVAIGEQGYALATVALDGATEYTVEVEPTTSARLVLLDPDGEPVDLGTPLVPAADGTYTAVVAGPDTAEIKILPLVTGTVDLTAEHEVELVHPHQQVRLDLEVRAGEQYEVAVLEGGEGRGFVLVDGAGEVVISGLDEQYQRFTSEDDATYVLQVVSYEDASSRSITVDVLELAGWWAYSGEDGDPHFLEEEAEPEVVLPSTDTERDVITWCLDITEGTTISFQVEPSLEGAVWKMDVFDDEDARDAGTPSTTYDDVTATDTFTLEATTGDATYCYDMQLLTEGTSSIDVRITEVTT